jgi:hypothetical protein
MDPDNISFSNEEEQQLWDNSEFVSLEDVKPELNLPIDTKLVFRKVLFIS